MLNLLNWLKQNVKDVIEFLKAHAIEVNIKKKETSEVTKNIVVSNLFLIFLVVVCLGIVWGIIRVHTIFFP
jgi:hypothetical protein